MSDGVHVLKTWVMKPLAVIVALIVALALVGVAPAAASRPAPTDTMTQPFPEAADGVLVQTCIDQRPSGWWLEAGYPNPYGCERCAFAGLGWEATGNYRAWCSKEANGAILWLFCVVCREGDGVRVGRISDRSLTDMARTRIDHTG